MEFSDHSEATYLVYQLVATSTMLAEETLIQRVFLDTLGIKHLSEDQQFSISPVSGWITFIDHKAISPKSTLLSTDKLLGIVDWFLESLQKNYQLVSKLYGKLRTPYFLSNGLRLQDIRCALNQNGMNVGYRVQYKFFLRYLGDFAAGSIPVHNSLLEIGLTPQGKINFLNLQWRPVMGKIHSPAIDAIPPHTHHEDILNENHGQTVAYYLSGENTLQTHLAPWKFELNGHHTAKTPLSRHCLKISLIKILKGNYLEVIAKVIGGSGKFRYEWTAWDISQREQLSYLGNKNGCHINGNNKHLVVTVTDEDLGISQQYQEFIFLSELGTVPAAEEKWERRGCTDELAVNYDPNANCDDGTCIYPVA